MRPLITSLLLVACMYTFAQPAYLRTYELPGDAEVEGADLTPDGGLIAVVIVDSVNMLIRLDAAGNVVWGRSYTATGINLSGTFDGSAFSARFMDVVATGNGLVVAGHGQGASWGFTGPERCLILLDAQGTPQAAKTSYPGPWGSGATGLDLSADELLVAGWNGGIEGGHAELTRMMSDTIVATGSYATRGMDDGQSSWIATRPTSIRATPDGGAVMAGWVTGMIGSLFIVKYNASYNVAWSGQWEVGDTCIVDGLTDGTVLFADHTRVGRFAPAGTLEWVLALLPGDGHITGMAARPNGNTVLTGPRTDGTAWLAELDPTGTVVASAHFGEPGDGTVPTRLLLTPDGGVRIAGVVGSAPQRLFSYASAGIGEPGDCSVPDTWPTFQATSLVPYGTLLHDSGTGSFDAPVVAAATNSYCTAATTCSAGGLHLQGTLFHDADGNGAYDSGESCFPNLITELQPDAVYAATNAECAFDLFTAQPGTHVLAPVPLDSWWTISTGSSAYTVEYTGGDSTITGLDFGYIPGLDTTVLTATLVTAPVLCNNYFGNPVQGWLHVLNTGTTLPDVVVALTLDSAIGVVSSEPPVDSVVGQTAYWHLDAPGYYDIASIHMQLQSPFMLDPGDTLHGEGALLLPGTLDTVQVFDWAGMVFCSYDPNDKLVTPMGVGTYGSIPPDTEWLSYVVRFQNTGTYAAADITVQDQLDPLVDPLSLQVLGGSHTLTGLHISGAGLVDFRFDNIQLPDSGADEAGSHGHIAFRVRPRPGLHHLDSIRNNAAIFFDQNAPVITNTVRNTIVNCPEAPWSAMIIAGGEGELWANYDPNGVFFFTYQWLFNGEPVPGATDMMLEATANGSYSVRLTDQYGCVKESEAVEVIVTGMATGAARRLHVYPDPMSEQAVVVLPEGWHGEGPLRILDATGRLVRSIPLGGGPTVAIERGGLMGGQYVLHIVGADGAVVVARLIVR